LETDAEEDCDGSEEDRYGVREGFIDGCSGASFGDVVNAQLTDVNEVDGKQVAVPEEGGEFAGAGGLNEDDNQANDGGGHEDIESAEGSEPGTNGSNEFDVTAAESADGERENHESESNAETFERIPGGDGVKSEETLRQAGSGEGKSQGVADSPEGYVLYGRPE
jgi:hypothetical protein